MQINLDSTEIHISSANGWGFSIARTNPILQDMLPRKGYQRIGGETFFSLGGLVICWTPSNWRQRAQLEAA
jgi:hypothetical protein